MWQNQEFVSTICSHCLSSWMFTVIHGIYPRCLHAFVNFLVSCVYSNFSFVTEKFTYKCANEYKINTIAI